MTDEAKQTPNTTDTKSTGTTGGPNPQSGSADAARGVGGHSKDADHAPGQPAGYVEGGEAKPKG